MYGLKKYHLLLTMGLLASCSSYRPKALPTQFSLPDNIPHVVIDQQQHAAMRPSHPIDPAAGLDMDDVAIVAVLNNPDLKIARDDAGIARAQAFAAGLLPDPQLALSRDLSESGGAGSSKAYSTGLSYDFLALLTYHYNDAAAEAEIKKTDLNLLWQEWQVIAQARLLYIKLVYAKKLQPLLESNRALLLEQVKNNTAAINKNMINNDTALPALSALQDIQRQLNDLERQTNQNRHDLNALLGLSPEAEVVLREGRMLPEIDDAAIANEAAELPQRRPDLMALQFGFNAQDQRYRAALLAQFPSLNVGFTRARDSTGITSTGFGITMSLPLLNRNRGNIAIEQATRDKLADDYQQRLDTMRSDIHRLMAERRINARQLADIQTTLPQLSAMVANADLARQKNSIDTVIVTNVHTALLARQIDALSLQQMMLEQQVALQSLLGGDIPEQHHQEKN